MLEGGCSERVERERPEAEKPAEERESLVDLSEKIGKLFADDLPKGEGEVAKYFEMKSEGNASFSVKSIFEKMFADDAAGGNAEMEESSSEGVEADTNNSELDNGDEVNPRKEEVDGKTYYCDDNGKLYRIDDNLAPNTVYEINGYTYTTDDKGRIISAEGTLRIKEHEGRLPIKDSIDAIGKGDQREGDDRGHLIGDQFDGSNGLENMIPQDADINRNDYKNLENELAKAVKEGKKVRINVEPVYEEDSRRPTAIIVTYSIDGEESVRVFPNEKGE